MDTEGTDKNSVETVFKMESLEEKVHAAARDNMSLTLYAFLSQKSYEEVRHLLSGLTTSDGQVTTPLIIAAKNGHEKVVQMLMNFYNVDIEQTGTVKFDGFVIEGATPLWCSSGAGHYNVVQLLLNHGADVNHATSTNSTPLRAACFDGRLDIVKYLISKGANLHVPNKYQNTCLMIASYKGHQNVVRFLLESGANSNDRAYCGATALHFAAERGFLQVVTDLVTYGGRLLKNNQGMTPLHVAAESSQAEIVEYFMSLDQCDKLTRVEALELLGASYANDKDNYDIHKCYHYLWLAMQERFCDPNKIFLKKVLPPIDAYGNQVESTTVSALELLKDNANALHMEALIIRERILGEDNIEIPHPIIFRGAVFADAARFDRCTSLWLRALKLQQNNNRSIAKDLIRFAQVFSQMIHVGVVVEFSLASKLFNYMLVELTRDLARCKLPVDTVEEKEYNEELLELNIHCAMYILTILDQIKRNKIEEFSLCQAVYKFNKMNLHLKGSGQTPLHMACDEKTVVDDFHVNEVVHFPNDSVVQLLLKCGANVHAVDQEGNVALHTIVRYNRPISDFLTLHNIIVKLLDSGTHFDRTNKGGETALQYTTTGVAEIIMRSRRKLSLKCIAAQVVRHSKIPYEGQVPETLKDFILLH